MALASILSDTVIGLLTSSFNPWAARQVRASRKFAPPFVASGQMRQPDGGLQSVNRLLHRYFLRYAMCMASDRMMQAIGRIERALSRLEHIEPGHRSAPSDEPPISRADAAAALKSLDDLIADLKGKKLG